MALWSWVFQGQLGTCSSSQSPEKLCIAGKLAQKQKVTITLKGKIKREIRQNRHFYHFNKQNLLKYKKVKGLVKKPNLLKHEMLPLYMKMQWFNRL